MRLPSTVTAVIASTLLVASAAVAQTPVTVTGEIATMSKYLFAGIPFSSGAVTQPHAIVSAGSFTFHGFATWDHDAGEVTEADVYGDYYRQLSPIVGAYAGAALYNFRIGDEFMATPEIYGGVVLGVALTPTLHVAHDFDLGDGTHAMLSVSHVEPLGEGGVTLGLGSSLIYNDGYWASFWQTAASDSGLSVFGLSAALGLPVGPVQVEPTLVIQRAIHDDFAHEEVFGVKASMTF